MKIKLYLILFLAILSFVPAKEILAQRSSTNYELQLKTGNVEIEENIETVILKENWQDPSKIFRGKYYVLLMFNEIPTGETKDKLRSSGISLFEYLPNYTFMAVLEPSANIQVLKEHGLRSVIDWKNDYKLAPTLQGEEYPTHALRPGNRIELQLSYYSNLHSSVALEALTQKFDVELIDINESIKRLSVSVPAEIVPDLATEPFITYVEPADPPSEPENYTARTLTRSNAIANDYASGRKYRGAGVTVMLQDDGLVGPHIDYTGRVDNSSTTSNSGDHGDHIAGTIMGAGNLNPITKGFAFAADLVVYNVYAGISDIANAVNNRSVVITSTSYSNGCNAGYTSFAREHDQNIVDYPSLMHVFSAGNSQGSDCGYGAGSQWGNITGGHKVGKNVIAVAALDLNGNLASFSSVGPAHDGRIKPDVGAKGSSVYSTTNPNLYTTKSGTSMSCPNVSGSLAQLYDAYKQLNAGANPPSALMKAIIMNTADDRGNPGPDYRYGYGLINNLSAVKVLENGNYLSSSVSQGAVNTHNISVPAGVQQLRVMVYWADVPAAVNANPALVNDLNMTVTDPSSTVWQPWVLNPAPNATTLNDPATRGIDNLNNVEQVTLDIPSPGTYTVSVSGFAVPSGPQTYYVVYSFVEDEIEVTYPVGGESLVQGETELIRWDAFGTTGNFTVEYSDDNGSTWNTISSAVPGNLRQLSWSVPSTGNIPSGKMLVRVSRGALSDVSDAHFSVIGVPTGLTIDWICVDSVSISWNAVSGATGYIGYVLGVNYMDSVATSTTTNMILTGLNPTVEDWISVSAIGQEDAKGRRAIAINKPANSISCPLPIDAGVAAFISPVSGIVTDCQDLSAVPVTVEIRNYGIDPLTNIPVTYSLNGGAGVNAIFPGPIAVGASANFTFPTTLDLSTVGNYSVKAFTSMPGDGNNYNDTLSVAIETISGTVNALPYNENFETFPLCGTLADCGATVCNMINGWINMSNGVDDDFDWRTDENGTPSSGTGPSIDHNPGTTSGNYLYLETSGTCTNRTANLISPCFDLNGTTAPQFSFWYHMFGSSMGTLHIDLFSGGTWTNDVVPAISGDQGDVWQNQTIDLSAYTGQLINMRFRGVSGTSWSSDIAIDDVSVFELAPPVTNFTADNTTPCVNETVNLIDQSANIPVSWQWTISPGTFSFVGGTTASSQNPFVVFTATGNYSVKLRTSNGLGSDSLTQVSFITVGSGAPLPYSEDFESFSLCTNIGCGIACPLSSGWVNSINATEDDTDWFVDEAGTGSVGTGPSIDHNPGTSTGNYIYVEATTCFLQEAYLVSPCIDLTTTTLPQLTYWYHMLGTTMGSLHVDIFDGLSWNLDVAAPISGNQGSNWNMATVDLSAFNGNTINIRFRGITGGSYESDIAIDDINVFEVAAAPVAQFASDKNTVCIDGIAELTDLSSNSPNSWQWSVSPGTFNYTGGTSANSQNPIIQFTAAGTYNITLISGNVFGYDTLTISSIVVATNGSAIPLTENFEGLIFPPAGGWEIENPDASTTWDLVASITGSDGNPTSAAFVDNYVYNAPGAEDILRTLNVDLSGTLDPRLTFDVAYAPYNANLFETLRIDVSTDCGDNFIPTGYLKSGTILATVPATTSRWFPSSSAHWRSDTVDLSAYSGDAVVIRFVNVNGFGNTLLIDNINFEQKICVAPSVSSSITNVLCNGGNSGSVNLSLSGGTSPFTYLWTDGEVTKDISGKAAGTYTVSITDAEGCTSTLSVQITEPGTISATTSKSNISCNGSDNGSARVAVSGGNGPYSYSWNSIPVQTSDLATGLPGGVYTCIITDANSCTKSVNVTIADPTPLLVFSIPDNPGPGDINLLVSGGIAPYNYNWSTGATTEDVFGLAPGFYFCQVADRNGCAQIHGVILNSQQQLPPPIFTDQGTHELSNDLQIGIYPNPATDLITLEIETSTGGNSKVEIYDISGKIISEYSVELIDGNNRFEFGTADLSTGIYRLRVSSAYQQKTANLIIQ